MNLLGSTRLVTLPLHYAGDPTSLIPNISIANSSLSDHNFVCLDYINYYL